MNRKIIISAFILFTLIVSTMACSPTQQAYKRNVEIYFANKKDLVLSNEEVKNAPYDLIYIKHGERPRATMALGFIEDGRYKWLSRDDVMLITENGRIIKSLGLSHNLKYVSNLASDPLKHRTLENNNAQWSRVIDTSVGDYGAHLLSSFTKTTEGVLKIHEHEFCVYEIKESVEYNSVVVPNEIYTNTFQYHCDTNQLLSSSQKISPNLDLLHITYVSRAIRLLEQNND